MQCCLFLSHGKSHRTKFQVFSEAMPLQPKPLGSWWKYPGIGLQHWGAGTSHCYVSPRGDRDDSAQCSRCVPSGPHLSKRTEFTVLSWASCHWLQRWFHGVCGDKHLGGMYVVLPPWGRGSSGNDAWGRGAPRGAVALERACAHASLSAATPLRCSGCFPGSTWPGPYRVWAPIYPFTFPYRSTASGLFSPLPHGWSCSSRMQKSTSLST